MVCAVQPNSRASSAGDLPAHHKLDDLLSNSAGYGGLVEGIADYFFVQNKVPTKTGPLQLQTIAVMTAEANRKSATAFFSLSHAASAESTASLDFSSLGLARLELE